MTGDTHFCHVTFADTHVIIVRVPLAPSELVEFAQTLPADSRKTGALFEVSRAQKNAWTVDLRVVTPLDTNVFSIRLSVVCIPSHRSTVAQLVACRMFDEKITGSAPRIRFPHQVGSEVVQTLADKGNQRLNRLLSVAAKEGRHWDTTDNGADNMSSGGK